MNLFTVYRCPSSEKQKYVVLYCDSFSGLKLIFIKLNWTVEALNFALLDHSLATSSAISSLLCHSIFGKIFYLKLFL